VISFSGRASRKSGRRVSGAPIGSRRPASGSLRQQTLPGARAAGGCHCSPLQFDLAWHSTQSMRSNVPDGPFHAPFRLRLNRRWRTRGSLDAGLVVRACPIGYNWRRLQPRNRNKRIPDQSVLKQGRDSGRCSGQHGADVAKPQRRYCLEPPDLAITNSDLADRVTDLPDRPRPAARLCPVVRVV
jgi:hypothetical protein